MTEIAAAADRPKRRRAVELVSAGALAAHLACTRQYIAKLTAEAVIERRGGGYDQDQCRLRYLARTFGQRTAVPEAAADAEHALAKAALLRLRVAKEEGELMLASEHGLGSRSKPFHAACDGSPSD